MTLDGLRFRPATQRDAHVVAELIAAGFATYTRFAPPGWRPRAAIQEEPEVHTRLGRGDVHGRVAFTDAGALVGFAGWMPVPGRDDAPGVRRDRAHVWSLFVAPDWWGGGLAGELLDWVVTGMRDSGYRTAQLWTPREHSRARAFYEREGWSAAGETVQFSADLQLMLVLYERGLRES